MPTVSTASTGMTRLDRGRPDSGPIRYRRCRDVPREGRDTNSRDHLETQSANRDGTPGTRGVARTICSARTPGRDNAATAVPNGYSKWRGRPGNSWTGMGSQTGSFASAPPDEPSVLCKEKEKVIQLGRHHAANDPPEQVTDTILHEIAHALAGTAAGHGPAWRSKPH